MILLGSREGASGLPLSRWAARSPLTASGRICPFGWEGSAAMVKYEGSKLGPIPVVSRGVLYLESIP
jgi:hypothetical protein